MGFNERYVGIILSSREGETSLIFKLQNIQESEVGLYTLSESLEGNN